MKQDLQNRVKTCLEELLLGGFADVSSYTIIIEVPTGENDYLMAVTILPFKKVMFKVDKSCKELPDLIFRGVVAHELGHIVQCKKSKLYLLWFLKSFVTLNFSKLQSQEELGAYLIAIQRGYGKEIRALAKYLVKTYKCYTA